MSKATSTVSRHSIERLFKDMSDRGSLETALVSDDRGFCWSSAGNHYDTGVLAALPSVLGEAVHSRRLRLRFYSGGKAGFDVDGADVKALLQDAGLSVSEMSRSEGYPSWLLSVSKAENEGSVEFTLTASDWRVVIRPLNTTGCSLFLVGIYSDNHKEKVSTTDPTNLGTNLERLIKLLTDPLSLDGEHPKAELVAKILHSLRDANPDIYAAALHMDDGLVVSSVAREGAEAESLAAIAAGIFHSCSLVGTNMLGNFPEEVCFMGESGILLGVAVRNDLLLTVLLNPDAGIGVAEALLRNAADRMAMAIAPQDSTKSQEV